MARSERPGMVALAVTVASAALGIAYFAYLNATPFPPTWVRLVALLWLGGALTGLIMGVTAFARQPRLQLALISILLGLPSVVFAAIFGLAALMGDASAPSGPAT